MKSLLSAALAASLLSLVAITGCTTSPASVHENEPAISAKATHNDIVAGESVLVSARTMNLVGAKDIKWTISPNAAGAKLQSDSRDANSSALFSADQPGVYVITATADAGNGRVVSSDTTVTVHGRGRNMAHE